MLRVEDLEAYYGLSQALKCISLEVRQGETVCLIGANGAGKTTLLNCLSGVHAQRSGKVFLMGTDVSTANARQLVLSGVIQVPEGRQLFAPLTVEENLEMGAYVRSGFRSKLDLPAEMDRVFKLFPVLKARRKQRAGTLSGGEQQMTAIGRGLMADPRVLLMDEPSLGLAPLIVKQIFSIIDQLRSEGRTILLVEQNAAGALNVSDRAYVIENGSIVTEGPSRLIMEDARVRSAFLGQDVRA
jgi:branched-chain amino acid transport system ATP-binding protein